MAQNPANSASFRRQLTIVFSIGVICLALISSLTTSWLGSNRTRYNLIEQGKQITQNFASQSTLALLYGAGENAEDAARGILEFPDVSYVAVFDLENTILLERGDRLSVKAGKPQELVDASSVLVNETQGAWRFAAQVYTDGESGPEYHLSMGTVKKELLGYVEVILSKATLYKMVSGIFISEISVSLTLAFILLLAIRVITERMTKPLKALSETMALAEKGMTRVRADGQGPKEVAVMSHAFNKMMKALEDRDQLLRRQNEELEQRVAERTAELAIARDDALKASHTKSAFLANMSHELRTPLNAIIGYSEILQEEVVEEGVGRFCSDLAKINSAGNHLLALINNVLDLSKIEAGKMELFIEKFSIALMVEDVKAVSIPLAQKNSNQLTVKCNGELGNMVADQTKVRQTLLNLLSNACKFVEHGHVALVVSQESIDGEDWIKFIVTDDGIGMTREQKIRIFEEFSQADPSTTRKYGGTGLGLSISRSFCKIMGGDIAVQSELGEGSAFIVRLPRHTREQVLNSPSKARAFKERRTMVSTVLVVDDNAEIREFIQDTLNQHGFGVVTATNAADGYKLAYAIRPALIVFNAHNSYIDCQSYVSVIKKDPSLAAIPIILLVVADDHTKGYALSIKNIVCNPLDKENVLNITRNCLDKPTFRPVLIVENQQQAKKSIAEAITSGGWPVITAERGVDATQSLTAHSPMLIFLDPLCLESDESRFLSALQQDQELLMTPVILIISGGGIAEERLSLNRHLAPILQNAAQDREIFLLNFTKQVALSVRADKVYQERTYKVA